MMLKPKLHGLRLATRLTLNKAYTLNTGSPDLKDTIIVSLRVELSSLCFMS